MPINSSCLPFCLPFVAFIYFATTAAAQPVTINNGFAPPHIDNVIDGISYPGVTSFRVYAEGCGPSPGPDCQYLPEVPRTTVALVTGGNISDYIELTGNAHLEMSGGTAIQVYVYGSERAAPVPSFNFFDQIGSVDITGGFMGTLHIDEGAWVRHRGGVMGGTMDIDSYSASVFLEGGDAANGANVTGAEVVIRGGAVAGFYDLRGESDLQIYGTGFAVDGVPVSHGEVLATSGLLTGSLTTGESVSIDICRGCITSDFGVGTIHLFPPPVIFDNGVSPPTGSNIISDASHASDDLLLRDAGCAGYLVCSAPGASTAVRVDAGASLNGEIELMDRSALWVDGGVLSSEVLARDQAEVVVTDGQFSDLLVAADNATLTISGGTFNDVTLAGESSGSFGGTAGAADIVAKGDTSFVMTDGDVTDALWVVERASAIITGGQLNFALVHERSTLQFAGGTSQSLSAAGQSTLEITDGTVVHEINLSHDATLLIRGGNLSIDINTQPNNTIEITGTEFTVDDVPVPYGNIVVSNANLKGTLPNGGNLDAALDLNSISILLVESTTPPFVPGLLGAGGVVLISLLGATGMARSASHARDHSPRRPPSVRG